MTGDSLFISDLHLAPERPEIISLFEKFVDQIASTADTLYILGDFLEYWIGDDDKAHGLEPVFLALQRLHQSGTRIRLMHGNRDFLIWIRKRAFDRTGPNRWTTQAGMRRTIFLPFYRQNPFDVSKVVDISLRSILPP